MATYDWTGLGLAAGTVLSNANINFTGNGTGTLVYIGLSAGATRVTAQSAAGNGVTIVGPATSVARNDTPLIAGGTECHAVDFIYKCPSASPTLDHHYLAVGRNVNATAASTGHVRHTTGGVIEFCNATPAAVSGGASPALVAGDRYRISLATIRNTLTTPTTSNGRIMGRILGVTDPAWNTTGEFFIDTGYTVNVTIDKTGFYRVGKAATACQVNSFDFLNLRWKDLSTPETSTTKALAITNFVLDSAPTLNTTGTGTGYTITAVGTPVAGGSLTYSITQTAGATHTPATTAAPGVWTVTQDTSASTTYDIQVDEAGGGSATTSIVVPASTTAALGGQFRRRKRVAGVWV